mgnify:CR=1 FL=1
MRIGLVEPFVRAGFLLMESLLGDRPLRDTPGVRAAASTTQQVNLVAEVEGAARGIVLYAMSLTSAQKIASILLHKRVDAMDDEAWAALGELGKSISAKANELLSQAGEDCRMEDADVIRGVGNPLSSTAPAIVVPMTTSVGRIEIAVALRQAENREAA